MPDRSKPFISDTELTLQLQGEKMTDLVKGSADLRLDTTQGADSWKGKGKQLWERFRGGGAAGMALKMSAALTVAAQSSRPKAPETRGGEGWEEMTHSPLSNRMLHPDVRPHQVWKSLSYPFWHPRMPVKAPVGITRRRAVEREGERETSRAQQTQQLKSEEEAKEAATLQFRRVEASLVTLAGAKVESARHYTRHCARKTTHACAPHNTRLMACLFGTRNRKRPRRTLPTVPYSEWSSRCFRECAGTSGTIPITPTITTVAVLDIPTSDAL